MARNDEGVTTLEALVATVIISIACALVFGASHVIIASSRKTLASCKAISAINLSDRAMRELVSEVRIPYWERHLQSEASDNSITLPWFRGIRDQSIALHAGSDSLNIVLRLREGERKISLLRDMDGISITPIYDDKLLYALEIKWKAGKREFHSLLPLGSCFPEISE